MKYLRVKNWGRFQQYKDRTPPWIKLHTDLLDNYEFSALPDASKAHLILIWVLASKVDNKIPARPDWIATKIFATEPVDLELLIEAGFLEYGDGSNWRANWASRYVSNKVRTQLLQEASHQCLACGSPDNLEIDHIVPISKGGTGEKSNLQVLCRACNRKKRATLRSYVEEPAQLRRPETETETENSPPGKRREGVWGRLYRGATLLGGSG